mmetsp:Transcript_7003/g.9102  ORF Transcript_7003/g.9102 Transcript_7003/m.9102 type:complete len:297 (-) Transcript_7003:26-916(-)
MIVEGTDSEKQEFAADLLGGSSWSIHEVSPLNSFDFEDSAALEKLRRKLEKYITQTLELEEVEIQALSTSFSAQNIKIVILNVSSTKKRCSLIICRGKTYFILSKGKSKLIKTLFTELEKRFDCSVGQTTVSLSPMQLSSFARKWTSEVISTYRHSSSKDSQLNFQTLDDFKFHANNAGKAQPLELFFEFPEGVVEAGLDLMKVAMPNQALLSVHKSMKENIERSNSDGEAEGDEVQFLQGILDFVGGRTQIRMNGVNLVRVCTPRGLIAAEGRIKFLCKESVESSFAHLERLLES